MPKRKPTVAKRKPKYSIAAGFDRLRLVAMAPDVGFIQLQETRRAFFAGAAYVVGVIDDIGEPEISDEEGMRILSAIHDELGAWADDLGTPRELRGMRGKGD